MEVWAENVKKHCFPLLHVCLNAYVLLEMFHHTECYGHTGFDSLRFSVHYESSPEKIISENIPRYINFLNVRSIFLTLLCT